MGAKIIIGTPGDVNAITIESDAKFTHSVTNNMNGNKIDSQEVVIDIEGDVTSGTSALIWTRIGDLGALAEEFSYLPVRIYLDAETTARYEYLPEEAVIGPLVTNFRTIADDGAGYSHWKYGLTITVTYPGTPSLGNSDAYETTSSIAVLKSNGNVVRKIWTVSVKSSSSARALAIVMSLKPSERFITEEISRFPQESRASGTWVWERRIDEHVVLYEETIQITGEGSTFDEDPQVGPPGEGAKPPLLNVTPGTAVKITLRGVVRGLTPDLKPPPPHWTSDGVDMIRQAGLEVQSRVVVDDWDRGTFKLEYQEIFWYVGSGDVPEADHGTHKDLNVAMVPPADGVIGSDPTSSTGGSP